ncbi:MalY/PatB family protein [Paraburkholderia fungorum]|uniref:MalY/PatB family protein n=1 Tax=Paraburkholderia fungorum TaxID=134537 RepID=UPI00402BDC21
MSFTERIDRSNTSSKKWDKYRGSDTLPLWLADMDFAAPDSVLAALHKRIEHGVMGYSGVPETLVDAVLDHVRRHYGWAINPEWLIWLPGVVPGLNLACRAAGNPGSAVVMAIPVYPPFLRAPRLAARELITVPLVDLGTQWAWDFDRLESAITSETRLLMLCHPHNPVGRAWRKDELDRLSELARKHDLIVCSDEVHCDLLLDEDGQHTPFAMLDPAFADRTITLMAPSKTWNLPGLGCAFAVIPDATLRTRFFDEMAGLVPPVNLLGYVAAEAAYRDSSDWHAELIRTLRVNRRMLADAFVDSALKMTMPQATYLAWIDARSVHPHDPAPVFNALGVGLSDGADFGLPGWLRINFGCPPSTLQEALRRMAPILAPVGGSLVAAR